MGHDITGIIIADDDPLIRSVLRSKLENLGQIVFLAADGCEAVEFAERINASFILLDLDMPRLNGLMACKRIRQMPAHAKTPIVALTALNVEHVEAAAKRAGVDVFLNKPIGMAQLLGLLSRYLPLDDATRRAVCSGAERAEKIAQTAPATVATRLHEVKDNPLERGKNVLAVLRG